MPVLTWFVCLRCELFANLLTALTSWSKLKPFINCSRGKHVVLWALRSKSLKRNGITIIIEKRHRRVRGVRVWLVQLADGSTVSEEVLVGTEIPGGVGRGRL